MKALSTLLFLIALAGTAAAQETRIAAIVNDDVLSLSDLANRIQLVMKTSSMPDNEQNRERVRSQVLRSMIDEKLQMQEAKRLNVTISKEDVEQAFTRLETQNKMQKGGLDQYLTQQGISRATLTDQISANLAWGKLVRGRLLQDVTISEEEVNEELKRIKDSAGTPQNRVSEIFLAIDNPAQDAEVKRVAERLIDQIRTGVSFAILAQQFSQSPTAAVGGDLGWVTAAQLAPALGESIQKMKAGEMSYPVHTSAGYYILYLVERRALGQSDPNDTVLSLVEVTLPATPQTPVPEQKRLLAQAQQISASVKSCGELAKIGRERAPQTSREIPEIKAGDLSPGLRQALLALPIAEASKPLPIQGGIGVVMVCQRKEAKGGLPSRDELQESLAHQRLDALARRYLRDLRRSAYVDIRG
jgi:peptidyl-prolyl cis-trans isomerase SurA